MGLRKMKTLAFFIRILRTGRESGESKGSGCLTTALGFGLGFGRLEEGVGEVGKRGLVLGEGSFALVGGGFVVLFCLTVDGFV